MTFLRLCILVGYYQNVEIRNNFLESIRSYPLLHPRKMLAFSVVVWALFRKSQQSLRYTRLNALNALKAKHGFTHDPRTFNAMSIEVAQEVEANMAEYEFPRLYQFAWISDFLCVIAEHILPGPC